MAFPTVVRRATAVSATTNNTTWSPGWTFSLDTATVAGDRVRWVAIITADGNPTLTETGGNSWTKHGQASDSTLAVTCAIFTYEDTFGSGAGSSPLITISSTASEQFSGVLFALKVATGARVGFLLSSSSQGSSTNSAPPVLTNDSGASRDIFVAAGRSGDSTVIATAAPTNYTNLQSIAGGGPNGASTNGAERQITIASAGTENPGTFTSATEQWVCFTFGIYEFSVSFPPYPPGAQYLPFLVR